MGEYQSAVVDYANFLSQVFIIAQLILPVKTVSNCNAVDVTVGSQFLSGRRLRVPALSNDRTR